MRRSPPIRASLSLARNCVIAPPTALSCRTREHLDFGELCSAEQTPVDSPMANQATG